MAFYAGLMDEVWVGDLRVLPQPGDFYGGWITANLDEQIKGAPGTRHWRSGGGRDPLIRPDCERQQGKEMSMRGLVPLALAAALLLAGAPRVSADERMIEEFTMQPETRWRFFTDAVMGGVSSGRVVFEEEDGQPHAHMTGRVSTANGGGFIQMRLDLASPPPESTTGVRLVVRGNDQRYFVHLRTAGTVLPWHYYQAGFEVTRSWSEVRLPLDAFASGALLRTVPRPRSLASVAIVAFGRVHDAEIEVREVGFY